MPDFKPSFDIRGETFREDQETRFVLERRLVKVVRDPVNIVDVENVTLIQFVAPIIPSIITNFSNGQPGQALNILGDGSTTIANTIRIRTNTGANKTIQELVYRFTAFDINVDSNNPPFLVWFEDA